MENKFYTSELDINKKDYIIQSVKIFLDKLITQSENPHSQILLDMLNFFNKKYK